LPLLFSCPQPSPLYMPLKSGRPTYTLDSITFLKIKLKGYRFGTLTGRGTIITRTRKANSSKPYIKETSTYLFDYRTALGGAEGAFNFGPNVPLIAETGPYSDSIQPMGFPTVRALGHYLRSDGREGRPQARKRNLSQLMLKTSKFGHLSQFRSFHLPLSQ
jgi:hypothetical protein